MTKAMRHISVQGPNGPVSVPEENVYFAFESGRWAYDCASCGAKCCRGHGFHVASTAELDAQLTTEPAVGMFMQAPTRGSNSRIQAVRNLTPGCFFLTSAGHCSIQLKHGYTSKPETCRLFP